MVDCRLCKHHYKIWNEYLENGEEDKFELVCLKKKLFVDKEYQTSGPCEDYVDVDGYDTE